DIKSCYNEPPSKRVPGTRSKAYVDVRPSSSGVRGKNLSTSDESGSYDASRCFRRFRRLWSRRHFKKKPRDYFFDLDELSPSEVSLYKKLEAYFDSLKKMVPSPSDPGKMVALERFIDTKAILDKETRHQRSLLFGEGNSF
ncbi:hypothetical protein A2U01_0047665, partial [Trifolium medium]|nr:hypothetical protein [Trifolium medium]